MLAEFAEAKGFTVDQLTAFGVRQGKSGLDIPYFDAAGVERPRIRLRTAIKAGDGSAWSQGVDELVPYGLNRPVPWTKDFAFIVEGETDCWALWSDQKPALGIPGAQNARCLQLEHVEGAKALYVIREPGEAGQRFPHKVADRLYSQGFVGQIFAIELEDAKDPHELWRRDPAAFQSNLRKAVEARSLLPRPKPEAKSAGPQALSMAVLRRKPRKKTEFLIEGLLPAGCVMLMTAKPKVGKSILARTMALAVARGTSFLDRACQQGSVLWARLEEPYDQFMDDFEAAGGSDVEDQFFSNDEIPELEDRMKWLVDTTLQMRPKLLVVDTWSQLTNVEDINNFIKVQRASAPLMILSRQYGIAQIWIHHNGKGDREGGDAVLGSSKLYADCDVHMSVKQYPNEARSIVLSGGRFGVHLDETQIVMDPVTKLVSVAAGRANIRNGQIEEQIIGLLGESDLTTPDLVDRLNFRKADVLAAIASLEERALINATGGGIKSDPFVYSIVLRNRIERAVSSENQRVGNRISLSDASIDADPVSVPPENREPKLIDIGTEIPSQNAVPDFPKSNSVPKIAAIRDTDSSARTPYGARSLDTVTQIRDTNTSIGNQNTSTNSFSPNAVGVLVSGQTADGSRLPSDGYRVPSTNGRGAA